MKRTLLLAACFLIAGCVSEAPDPETSEIRLVTVRETAKITAAWEAVAQAEEMEARVREAERELDKARYEQLGIFWSEYREARHAERMAKDAEAVAEAVAKAREAAATAQVISLEEALQMALNARRKGANYWMVEQAEDEEKLALWEEFQETWIRAAEAWEATFEGVELPNE